MQRGYFFKRLTGQSIRDSDSLLEIEQAVADRYRRPLRLSSYDADVIAEHGNVFAVAPADADLDQAIDHELARMRWERG
ncbi:hypothetical protein [Thiocystis violacea]|uniref:hypothetical protein n=1 Tax=Thiocystis violacea TaxID=13725 RepID=UPI0019078630|nr:hypothetical protein [Thiocystis violacea]MBK1720082.1 hypothetical protein [Thiocystis violacea]